jgi:hypothetical protein
MIIPKTRLVNNITQELSDNSTAQISPRDIRHNLLDVIDSIHLLTRDQNIESLNFSTPDQRNVQVGISSLESLRLDGYTSTDNVAVGYATLKSSYRTRRNTALGSYALSCNIHGDGNLAVGYNALAGNTTGNSNVAIGTHTLNYNKRGNFNIAIGNAAGYYIGTDDSYKFYVASHPIEETYICDNPQGVGLLPLMFGDLASNKLGINTNILHDEAVLQTSGNIAPSKHNEFTLGTSSYAWDNLYTANVSNLETHINLENNFLKLTATSGIDILSSSGIYLSGDPITIGGSMMPDKHATYDLGYVDNRFNIGYFEEILTDYVTALQKSFFSHKTLYLASSGEWSIDGGGPSSLYEYYPCPNSPDIIPILTDPEIQGGGFVLQSTQSVNEFVYKNDNTSCGTFRRWKSNIGIEIDGIDNYLKAPAIIGSQSQDCYGIFMSGNQTFFSPLATYKQSHDIAGNGSINFYAPDLAGLDDFIITYSTTDTNTNISQRFLSSTSPREQDNDLDKLTGFETKYIDETDKNRLVMKSYNNSTSSKNHFMLMGDHDGVVGINNFSLNGDQLLPETFFNIRSVNDAVVRVSAETNEPSMAAIQLLSPQNCLNSGLEIFYNNSGIFELSVYDDFDKHNIFYSDSGDHLGIYSSLSGMQDLVTIGDSGNHPNAVIALHENPSSPTKTESYGKLYVKSKTNATQSQTLKFLDDAGYEHDLIPSKLDSNDGLIYSVNGSTFGGLNCPDVRGDTPNASNNTAYGFSALNRIDDGNCNTMFGHSAGQSITDGFNNIGIGCGVLSECDPSITNNIAIGNRVGVSLTTNYNFLLGVSSDNLLFKATIGPSASDKHLYMPEGHITLEKGSNGLHLTANAIESKDSSGLDYPEDTLSIKMSGNESADVVKISHKDAPAFDIVHTYHAFSPKRPSMEVLGDVRVKGGVCFRDGSFLESAFEIQKIEALERKLDGIFVEGVALEDIGLANGIESPTQGVMRLRNQTQVLVTNRDQYSSIKKDDYIIAIKIGQEYRPIWISNSSSVCTCCTK